MSVTLASQVEGGLPFKGHSVTLALGLGPPEAPTEAVKTFGGALP